MFSKLQYESTPTKMALDQKVLRAHYIVHTWKLAHIYPHSYCQTYNNMVKHWMKLQIYSILS